MVEIDNLVINVEVTGNTNELHDIAILIEGIDKKTEKATSKMASFGASIKNMLKGAAFIKTMGYLGKAINKSMEYTESMNLFTVAMGEYADEARKYAEEVSQIMGIDPAEWLKAQGTFNILATGFGVAADKAAIMSKNLTQLGYDISSFYNINVQDAMTKLQSGLAGELEPLRRLGYDLSVARLQQEAYALGIDKSVTAMTQAEKSMLRYHAIMSQVTEVQGDMARTLESPANQMRILKAQIDQLTRSIGNTLIPVINALLPYMIALAQMAREAADAIAAFFGYELPTVDFSSVSKPVGDISTGLDDATAKAKELKRSLMGFDEINKLNDTSSGKTNTSSSGVGFDMELPEYNFLGEQLKSDLDAVKQKLQELMPLIAAIATAFATWKLSSFLKDIGVASGRLEALRYAAALTITVAGVIVEWSGVISAFKNGLNKSNFGAIASGAILTVIGGAMLGKLVPFVGVQLGAALAAIVAGIPMFVTGIHDALENELNVMSASLIAGGATLAGAGAGAIIGAFGGPIGAGIGALIGLAIGGLTDLGILIYQKWDEISAWFKGIPDWFDTEVCQPVENFFVNLWSAVSNWTIETWNKVKNWFKTSLVDPISNFFSDLWSNITTKASEAWTKIKDVFKPVTTFFSDLWTKLKTTFTDLGTKIGDAVSNGFKTALNGALGVIESILNAPIIAINELLDVINKVPGISLSKLDTFTLPRLAEGGQIDAGQLFIAREAGAEMVGAIGRKTTVANNQQIVDGIYKGVYQAMRDAGTGNNGGNQTIVVMLPNGDVLGETFVNWHNGVVKQTGNTPLFV